MSRPIPVDTFENGVFVKGAAQLQIIRHEGVTVEYAATVTPNLRKSTLQKITLTGDCTIANPTGAIEGTEVMFIIAQDATGGHEVTWGSDYDFGELGAPSFTDDAGLSVTVVRGLVVVGQGKIVCQASRGDGAAAADQDFAAVTVDSLNGWSFLSGTVVPSAGGGVAATAPAMYAYNNAGTWTYYGKTGAADTAWTQFDPID